MIEEARVLASIGEIAAPTRRELVRRQSWFVLSGVAGALTLFWVEGGLRATGRPPSLVAWTSLGTSGFVGVGMWFLFTRGRSGLRRPWPALVLATLVPALAFVLWRYGFGQPLRPRESLADASRLPLLRDERRHRRHPALRRVARLAPPRSDVAAATGAAFGAGAGLGSALLIDIWCPVSYVPHLLIGHVLPIAFLAAVGAAVGRRVLGAPRR